MKLSQLIVLLPCQSLEDFSLSRNVAEAEELLSAWSALWHPALLAEAQTMPSWFPAEGPPQESAGQLVMLPKCSRTLLPDGWLDRAKKAGACVLEGLRDRDQVVAAALEQLDTDQGSIDPKLVADFLALGFCHFQVELLTRQLRYMSNLDEESFESALLRAVEKVIQDDAEAAREELQSAFNLLNEAREYFYPVEANLLDLTLVAPSTLGESLRTELSCDGPTNLLVSGEVIQSMARQEPATLAALIDALEKNTAAIIGGEFSERALPLLVPEVIRNDLEHGLTVYQQHLGTRPVIFGRRRFGISPVLPQILKELAFTGTMHSTLDEGRFPTGNQSRIQWEGIDGTVLETLARVPIDATRADAFLRLSERLGNAMDLDHVATVVLAHWPGQSSRWYDDLRRVASYGPVLGRFATINDYFAETGLAGQQTSYRADQYRSPYLMQAVAAGQCDPISRWVRYFGRRAAVDAARTLDALTTLAACGFATGNVEQLANKTEASLAATSEVDGDLDEQIERTVNDAMARFHESLGTNRSDVRGYFVANPSSFSRRLCLDMPELSSRPDETGAVRAAGPESVVVDVPPMGFAWVGPGSGVLRPSEKKGRRHRKKRQEDPPLAEENVLRNEFFEVAIDPHTGAIRSISDYHSRGARLAQQIALRMPQTGGDAEYSLMTADEITVTSAGPILGEIVCRGRLVDRQVRRLAGFRQTTRVRRGSRMIELQIDLDTDQLPDPNPWNSYYAARFAWGDATANLYRSVNLANLPTDAYQLEAPHFIDIRSGKLRTTVLCGGLPYHRRFGLRKLDTMLVVRGETARSFRLGIGIDLPHPIPAALDFLIPPTLLPAVSPPPIPSGWLFHLDARNVIATRWEPVLSEGRVEGFRVRLLETDGRQVRLGLRSFRALATVRRIHSDDTLPAELPVEGDRISIEIDAHEWIEVEGRFVP